MWEGKMIKISTTMFRKIPKLNHVLFMQSATRSLVSGSRHAAVLFMLCCLQNKAHSRRITEQWRNNKTTTRIKIHKESGAEIT